MSRYSRSSGKLLPQLSQRRSRWTRASDFGGRESRFGFGWLVALAIVAGLVAGLLLWPDDEPARIAEQPVVIDTQTADVIEDADLEWEQRGQDEPVPAPATQAMGVASGSSMAGRTEAIRARFGFCHEGGGTNCVVDGDTFRIGGEKVRIAGIDAPETHPSRCPREAQLGEAATRRLHALLNSGQVTMTSSGRNRDRHGRLLRDVQVDGADVGEALIASGVAREYGNGRKSWCA